MQAAQRRVERGEQLIGGECAGAGQAVEQRRLAGVRVTDERDGAHRGTPPRPPLGRALAGDLREAPVQHLDARSEEPAIGLELGFARAAEADAALLALEVAPAADESGELVLHLRQLHLKLAFGAACALGEDVEDQRGAIHHAAFESALQVALLRAGQRVIEDDKVGSRADAPFSDFFDLALAREQRGIGPLTAPRDRAGNRRARGHRECAQFREALARIARSEIERDQQCAVRALRAFVDQCGTMRSRRGAGQTSASAAGAWCGMATARAGTTVEIACL